MHPQGRLGHVGGIAFFDGDGDAVRALVLDPSRLRFDHVDEVFDFFNLIGRAPDHDAVAIVVGDRWPAFQPGR